MEEALEKLNLREIDALVAEHVLEIPVEDHGFSRFTVKVGSSKLAVPPYSTDIAAAWDVVEKLQESGFCFFIETRGKLSQCSVEVFLTGKPSAVFDTGEVFADTVPMAICLAALKAKGIEV